MEQKRPSFRHIPAAEEEEKVWVSFYRNASDPDLAAELIAHLDKDIDSRTQYPGLYLRCKQSVRRKRERQARAKRYANAIQMVLRVVLLVPASAIAWSVRSIRSMARFGGDVALNALDGGGATMPRVSTISTKKRAASASKSSAATGIQKAAESCSEAKPADIVKSA